MPIIAISGKIGCGKDTVGLIIQYLSGEFTGSFHDFQELAKNDEHEWLSNWETRKFADTLKDMICMLTGCSRKDLESQEFKDSFLPEAYNYVETPEGRMQEDFFANDPAFIADPDRFIKRYTYRDLLQQLGTELMRTQLHNNVWVNSLMSKYKGGDWIITDCRFPNEADSVKQEGGYIIRVNRITSHPVSNHASEVMLDNYKEFDLTIENNEPIGVLVQRVGDWMREKKLLNKRFTK